MEQYSNMSDFTNPAVLVRYTDVMSSMSHARPADDDSEYEYMTFGDALRYYRERAGFTQKQLAGMLGHSTHSTLAGWEQRAKPIRSDYSMEQMANLLRVPVDDLALGRVPRPTEPLRTYQERVDELSRALLSGPKLDFSLTMARAIEEFSDKDAVLWTDVIQSLLDKRRAGEREAQE